ncbi:MAG TPA: hypothetical protein VHY30_07320 [Verrucomicrobiae bacterium]|jgi:hypothetical protein|nr:hypothetical protein [Verrucomicrobiae bacterium]
MNAVAISADTVLSSSIFATEFEVVSSTLSTNVQIAEQSNFSGISIEELDASSTVNRLTTQISDVQHWSAEKGQHFRELTLKEAIGELSTNELAELESLTRLRRSEKYPRTADEILWHRSQQNVTRGLVQALQTYVEFHETPRHA